jgi:hypothetical protein
MTANCVVKYGIVSLSGLFMTLVSISIQQGIKAQMANREAGCQKAPVTDHPIYLTDVKS